MAWDSKLTGEQKGEILRLIEDTQTVLQSLRAQVEANVGALSLMNAVDTVHVSTERLNGFMEDVANG